MHVEWMGRQMGCQMNKQDGWGMGEWIGGQLMDSWMDGCQVDVRCMSTGWMEFRWMDIVERVSGIQMEEWILDRWIMDGWLGNGDSVYG